MPTWREVDSVRPFTLSVSEVTGVYCALHSAGESRRRFEDEIKTNSQTQVGIKSNNFANSHQEAAAKLMFHEIEKRASSTPVSKTRELWKVDQKSMFFRGKCIGGAKHRWFCNYGITEWLIFKSYVAKTLRYAEMIRITERKRFGQCLQMIICLRDSRKNANIGDQFSKLTRRKPSKNMKSSFRQ